MKEWLTFATEHAVVIIDVLALIVIFAGTVECFLRGMGLLFSWRSGDERRDVWLRYARWLVGRRPRAVPERPPGGCGGRGGAGLRAVPRGPRAQCHAGGPVERPAGAVPDPGRR